MRLLLTFIVLGFSSVTWAGPLDGELFGYKLGTRYPLTDKTQGRFYSALGQVMLLAEWPKKSDDFQRIELITTPKTLTIANIYGIAEFSNEAPAKAFATRYADLLSTVYADKCRVEEAFLGESLKLLCGEQFELTVSYYRGGKYAGGRKEKHKVHVGLTFSNDREAGKQLLTQFKHEWEEMETEGKKYRLEQAKKMQQLRGLQ